jgi:hypothetical protein
MATQIYEDNPPQYFKPNIPNIPNDVLGYRVKVRENSGATVIYKKTKDGELLVGTFPKGEGFAPGEATKATRAEIDYFTANARKTVNDQAVPMMQRVIGGGNETNKQINEILGTHLSLSTAQNVQDAIAGVEDINLLISSKGVRTKYGNYYYPADLVDNRQDRIKFIMKTSEGSVISTKNFGDAFSRKPGTKIEGSVTLPIQPSISDDSTVDWSGATLNPISAYAAGAAIALQGDADMGGSISGILGEISKQLKNGEHGNAMKVYFAQEAVGIQGLLSRATGAILNPNLELLFNGPSLRPFGFTFKMSPRDAKEAIQVKNIIRFFKQGMSVKNAESEIYLKSPNVFDIKYQTYDKKGKEIPHPSIGRIKTCALMGCGVDYAPDNTYMTFDDDDRTMTSYQMTLRFSELDPIYESDYSELSDNEIGY